MTIQQLRYVIAIGRELSFAKASEILGVSQPTLSAMLRKLEEELDVIIFERDNKKVEPTALGRKIIRQAEAALVESVFRKLCLKKRREREAALHCR